MPSAFMIYSPHFSTCIYCGLPSFQETHQSSKTEFKQESGLRHVREGFNMEVDLSPSPLQRVMVIMLIFRGALLYCTVPSHS
mmetsp:Transcript_126172/g.218572  ORF Transcript_126172/g.218572 Transcript_126172/m.218572 type:complete len:82 (-) Transcript_126172:344-589(-)